MAGEAVTGTGAVGEREPRNRARGGGQNGRGEEGEAGRRGAASAETGQTMHSQRGLGHARGVGGVGSGEGGAGRVGGGVHGVGRGGSPGVALTRLAEPGSALGLRLRSEQPVRLPGQKTLHLLFGPSGHSRPESVLLLPNQGHRE